MPGELLIPIFYHPTNVLFLDDDRSFLTSLSLKLAKTTPFVLESEPNKAYHHITTHMYSIDSLSKLITKQNFSSINKLNTVETFDIDFSILQSQLDTPDRYKKIVAVFVDKSMPDTDGLAWCQKIREAGLPVKLILFTGIAGTQEAVNAFNQKLIDAYLPKGSEAIAKIDDFIEQYTWQQFLDLSHYISGLLSHVLKPLYDEQFLNVFQTIRKKHDINEFYLINSSCSFLMLTPEGSVKILLMHSKEDFEEIYDIAKDSKAPHSVLEAIRERQMFPCEHPQKLSTKLQGDMWEDIMKPVDKVPGREWYYTVIDHSIRDIVPFNIYRDEIWPIP